MKLLCIGLLIAGCGSKTSAPKLDCDAFAKKAATGLMDRFAAPVIQAAKEDCERGAVKQAEFDCIMAVKTLDGATACFNAAKTAPTE